MRRAVVLALVMLAACRSPTAARLDSAGLEPEGWFVLLSDGRTCRGIPWQLEYLSTPAAAIAVCQTYYGER